MIASRYGIACLAWTVAAFAARGEDGWISKVLHTGQSDVLLTILEPSDRERPFGLLVGAGTRLRVDEIGSDHIVIGGDTTAEVVPMARVRYVRCHGAHRLTIPSIDATKRKGIARYFPEKTRVLTKHESDINSRSSDPSDGLVSPYEMMVGYELLPEEDVYQGKRTYYVPWTVRSVHNDFLVLDGPGEWQIAVPTSGIGRLQLKKK